VCACADALACVRFVWMCERVLRYEKGRPSIANFDEYIGCRARRLISKQVHGYFAL